MVENLTRRAVFKDKLSGAATDLMTKLDRTVQNFGSLKPTEQSPMSFKVTHKGGALVRSGLSTSSAQVHQLGAGEIVSVVELCGRRARIVSPLEGWLSTETKEGVQIMRPCTLQRRARQNEAFESMFEQKFNRLKRDQGLDGRSQSAADARARGDSRDRSTDRERDRSSDEGSDSRDHNAGRGRDSRRGQNASTGNERRRRRSDSESDRSSDRSHNRASGFPRDRSGAADSSVPKLAMPGMAQKATRPPAASSSETGGPRKAEVTTSPRDPDPKPASSAPPYHAADGGALSLLEMSIGGAADAFAGDLLDLTVAPTAKSPSAVALATNSAEFGWDAFQQAPPQAGAAVGMYQQQMGGLPHGPAALGGPGGLAGAPGFGGGMPSGSLGAGAFAGSGAITASSSTSYLATPGTAAGCGGSAPPFGAAGAGLARLAGPAPGMPSGSFGAGVFGGGGGPILASSSTSYLATPGSAVGFGGLAPPFGAAGAGSAWPAGHAPGMSTGSFCAGAFAFGGCPTMAPSSSSYLATPGGAAGFGGFAPPFGAVGAGSAWPPAGGSPGFPCSGCGQPFAAGSGPALQF